MTRQFCAMARKHCNTRQLLSVGSDLAVGAFLVWGLMALLKSPPAPKRPAEPATLGATIAASMAKLLRRMGTPDKPAPPNEWTLIAPARGARR